MSRNFWFSGVLALDSGVRFSRCVWSTNAKRFVYHYTLNNNVYTMYMLVLIIISIPNTCYTQYNIILLLLLVEGQGSLLPHKRPWPGQAR